MGYPGPAFHLEVVGAASRRPKGTHRVGNARIDYRPIIRTQLLLKIRIFQEVLRACGSTGRRRQTEQQFAGSSCPTRKRSEIFFHSSCTGGRFNGVSAIMESQGVGVNENTSKYPALLGNLGSSLSQSAISGFI